MVTLTKNSYYAPTVPSLSITDYLFSNQLFANDYEDAWKALDHNDRKKARELLLKAMNDPHTAVDAYLPIHICKAFKEKAGDG